MARTGGWLAVLLLLQTGCSFLLVRPPPKGHKNLRTIECTSSPAAPVVDTVIATLDGLGALSWLAAGADPPFVVGGFLGMAIFGASAAYGYGATNDCRKAEHALVERSSLRRGSNYDDWLDPEEQAPRRGRTRPSRDADPEPQAPPARSADLAFDAALASEAKAPPARSADLPLRHPVRAGDPPPAPRAPQPAVTPPPPPDLPPPPPDLPARATGATSKAPHPARTGWLLTSEGRPTCPDADRFERLSGGSLVECRWNCVEHGGRPHRSVRLILGPAGTGRDWQVLAETVADGTCDPPVRE